MGCEATVITDAMGCQCSECSYIEHSMLRQKNMLRDQQRH